MTAKDVLNFWFVEISANQQFKKDRHLDQIICDRFGSLYEQASRCELFDWRTTPDGRLAEIIVLDQFPRNIFRDLAQAFQADPLALALAQEAVRAGYDQKIKIEWRAFLYMPFMHSESQMIHEVAAQLFQASGLESNYQFELKHKAIIDRFGRFPHRNEALGRQSTAEEIEFLKGPGSRF